MELSTHISYKLKEKSLRKLLTVLTLYYGHKMKVQKVAKELEMNPMTISRLLNQYGKGTFKPFICFISRRK